MYNENTDKPGEYEKELIVIMIDMNYTLSEAIHADLLNHNVDIKSVFDIVDYMEFKFENLDKVQYYMNVYTGNAPDVALKRNNIEYDWYKKYEKE